MPDYETPPVLVLGAEHQAATSLALAYPERRFLFASDCAVVDGWDLANVRMVNASPPAGGVLRADATDIVPLSARWLADPAATSLSACLPTIEAALPGVALPVFPSPDPARPSIVKGDLWHRPDVPLTGNAQELADLADPNGCGCVYQELIQARGCVMAVGRRGADGVTSMGLFRVFNERFFRIDVLQAAESVDLPGLMNLSHAALSALAFDGWFTLNWLLADDGPRLSSFRPVPKAAFRCLRSGGIDLLQPGADDMCLAPGLRIIANPHYASFEWLAR